MIRILKYTEYLYLAIALISVYEIWNLWGVNQEKTYLFMFFAVVSAGMFLFRRNYRRRFEKRNDPGRK